MFNGVDQYVRVLSKLKPYQGRHLMLVLYELGD